MLVVTTEQANERAGGRASGGAARSLLCTSPGHRDDPVVRDMRKMQSNGTKSKVIERKGPRKLGKKAEEHDVPVCACDFLLFLCFRCAHGRGGLQAVTAAAAAAAACFVYLLRLCWCWVGEERFWCECFISAEREEGAAVCCLIATQQKAAAPAAAASRPIEGRLLVRDFQSDASAIAVFYYGDW